MHRNPQSGFNRLSQSHEEIKVGNRVLINDGLSLVVKRIDGTDIVCRMVEEGTILPRKGVNLPEVPLIHLSSFTEKDKADLAFGFKNKLDYVALSFVRSGEDVAALKEYMAETFGYAIPVISKIEKPEAVDNIDRIVDESSAIVIARGDGRRSPAEEVP